MICFYGEFDPFTGSIPPQMSLLPSVCRRLKLLVAACDRVIIAPGSMLEHPLVLPAFEALAPLFAAGRLTTSVQAGGPGPAAWLDERIARQVGHIPPKGRRAGTSRGHFRRYELAELRGRWQAVMPAEWVVVRDIPRIVGTYVDEVRVRLGVLAAAPHGGAVQALVDLIDQRRDAGDGTDRNRLLAALGTVRGRLVPVAVEQAFAMIQGVYFRQGTSTASKWVHGPAGPQRSRFVLYPGFFARVFGRVGGPFAGDLPVSMALAPWRLHARLTRVGISPGRLSRMPADALRDLVASPGWAVVRRAVVDEGAPSGWLDVIRGQMGESSDPARVVHRLEPLAVAPTTVTDDWTLAITGDLGAMSSALAPGRAVFDPVTGDVCSPDGSVSLGPEAARLLMAVLGAGDAGLAHDQLARLLREAARIEGDVGADAPGSRPGAQLAEAIDLRVDVALHRLGAALASVGVELVARRGRVHLDGWPVRLADPRWRLSAMASSPPPAQSLPPQLARVWRVLAAFHPGGCGADALGQALGMSGTQAAQVVARLALRLRSDGFGWRVVGGRGRPYRLVPKLWAGGEVS